MQIKRQQRRATNADLKFIFKREGRCVVMIGDPKSDVEGEYFCKHFSYLVYGGTNSAIKAARQYRDAILKQYPELGVLPWKERLRDPEKGICISQQRAYVIATYPELRDGKTKRMNKYFRFDPTSQESIDAQTVQAKQFRAERVERYIKERENFEKLKRGNRK